MSTQLPLLGKLLVVLSFLLCSYVVSVHGAFHGASISRSAVKRRRTQEPLNEQEATTTTDLDELDVDLERGDQPPPTDQPPSSDQPPPSSVELAGDATVIPMLSSMSIDMSVVPEPTPKVDAVEPSSLPSYGGIGLIRIIGQHFGTENDLDQVVSINGRACKETKWISVTILECVGPPSFTVNTKADVTVNVAHSSSDPTIDGGE